MVHTLDRVPEYEHSLIRRLYEYWLKMSKEGRPPKRSDIDPLDLVPVLPYIWIYEMEESGRFYCRLAGENIRAVLNRKVINEYMDEFVGESGQEFLQTQYEKILTVPAIGHTIGQVYTAETKRFGQGERLILPLRDEAGGNRFILGATIYRTGPLPNAEDLEQETLGGPGSALPKQSADRATPREVSGDITGDSTGEGFPIRTLTPLSIVLS